MPPRRGTPPPRLLRTPTFTTIKIRMDSSTGNEVTEKGAGGNYIKIAYTKTACFDTANTNVSAIYIDGVPAYTVKLVSDTGKHFIEK